MFFRKNKVEIPKLFKYKTYNDRTLDSLMFNYYWTTPISKMNDAFEGMNSFKKFLKKTSKRINSNNSKSKFESLVIITDDFIDFVLNKIGVLCLTTDNKNQLMWAHYANEYRGLCIEYDFKITQDPEKIHQSFPVSYSKNIPDFSEKDMLNKGSFVKKICGIKSECWSYEKELRLIMEKGTGSFVYDKSLLKAVYFGVRFDENYKNDIFRALKDTNTKFYQMVMDEGKYSFSYEEIIDIPNFTYHVWTNERGENIEFNYELKGFQKQLGDGGGWLVIYTKDFVSEELAKDFYEHIKHSLFSGVKNPAVSFVIEGNGPSYSYYCFKSNDFTDNREIASIELEQGFLKG